MGEITGHELVARSLKNEGVEALFYLMGAPIIESVGQCQKLGIQAYYFRHEQAAAMAAHAYARATGKTGVCVTASGPGTLNAATGLSNANADAAPVLCIGGSRQRSESKLGAFQEMDQVPIMAPFTKLSFAADLTRRIPEYLSYGFRHAQDGCKGAVYVDFPADTLGGRVDVENVYFPEQYRVNAKPVGHPSEIERAIETLRKASRPIIVYGSGVLWSEAWDDLRAFVDTTGIPFFTTPQSRGAVSEDHDLSFNGAKSLAFREADAVLAVGARGNSMLFHFRPPQFNAAAKFVEVNIDGSQLGHNRPVEVGIQGDAGAVLQQLTAAASGVVRVDPRGEWIESLRAKDAAAQERNEAQVNSNANPIHPARLCKEVRETMGRDSVLIEDAHELMGFARHNIPSYGPRQRMNAGPQGCMGVGVPFGIGAQVGSPGKRVIVLCGDGAFGWNGMEMETAVRHKLPIKVIIGNNGGFTAGGGGYGTVGRDLGWHRYDAMMEAIGVHGEWVEEPDDIRPAIERAFAHDGPAIVNVRTDQEARSSSRVGFDSG